MTIHIGGKDREVQLRFLAVRKFKQLTGVNLSSGKVNFFEFIGQGNDIDPDRLVSFLYAVLCDGAHPNKPDFDEDDVASWITVYDKTLIPSLFELWAMSVTGKTKEELVAVVEKLEVKNQPAPEHGAIQTTTVTPTA